MRFLLIAGLFTLLSSASAQSLDLNDGPPACDDYWVSMNNQTQLDFYSACPVFESVVFVGHKFSGPFELPGIVSVGRISAGYLLPKLTGSKREDDPVTSISFPDLKNTTETWMGGIMAAYLEYLTDVSFPKLENVTGDLVLLDNPELKKAEFPALQNVSGGIWIDGDFDKISFPSLQKVGYMNVKSTGDIDCVALGKNLSSLIFTEKEKPFGGDLGLTCWTFDENNRWNSSDPERNAQAAGPSSTASASGSSSGSPSTSETGSAANPTRSSSANAGNAGNAATALHVGFVNVILASVGIAFVGGLLM